LSAVTSSEEADEAEAAAEAAAKAEADMVLFLAPKAGSLLCFA